MKVSVIIPVYKVEPYLRQCVDSVLNQTYRDIEVILVDDGSPDNCPRICDEYAARDSRVIVIHKDNGGLSDARNAGVSHASGDYGIFIDSDDYWDNSDCLAHLVSRVNESKCDVLSFSYYKLEEASGQITRMLQLEADMPANISGKAEQLDYLTGRSLYIASACNKLVRLSLLRELPFEKGRVSEDVEWCARLMSAARSFDFACDLVYCYRQREGSIAHTTNQKTCVDLCDATLGCAKIAWEGAPALQPYFYRYAAYQLAAFIAVQAFAETVPKACIQKLTDYQWLLAYHGGSKKVKYLYIVCRMIGFRNTCRLVRMTKAIWDKRRNAIGK